MLCSLLKKQLPDWRFRLPAGGFFLWVRLPSGDARELAQVALRHGVLILPGETMSVSGLQSSYLRLPFLAESAVLRAGIERLAAAWREYRSSARINKIEMAVI